MPNESLRAVLAEALALSVSEWFVDKPGKSPVFSGHVRYREIVCMHTCVVGVAAHVPLRSFL